MPECYFCKTEMIWGADFTREDYGYEGDGIVATFSCPHCGASAEFVEAAYADPAH